MVKAFVRQFALVEGHMKPIFAAYWNICLLRQGPEFVPTHPLFVGGVIIADICLSFFFGIQYGTPGTLLQEATETFVTMATLTGAIWIALNARGVIARYPATIAAMFGCDLLFNLTYVMLVPLAGGVTSPIIMGVSALLGLWSIAVNGFILHRAMNVTLFIGIFVAFCVTLLAFALSSAAAGR
jgi:hypothetical protein